MGVTHSRSKSPRPSQLHLLLLLLVAVRAFAFASPSPDSSDDDDDDDDDQDAPEPTITTAPVFLPHYDQDNWSLVRGSIISSNDTATETTYTIFCPTETPPACDLALEFPFVIVEGPHTVKFHGTVTSSYTANLECDLNGTVAATCSGYSSFKTNYLNGPHTGPTELNWTTTFLGPEVEWGTLTMAEPPSSTSDSLGISITSDAVNFESSEDLYYMPSPTDGEGAGTTVRRDGRLAVAAMLSGLVAAGFAI